MPAGGSVPAGESVKVIGWLSERERLRESSGESVKVLSWLSERGGRLASPCRKAAGRCWIPARTMPGRGAICVKIIDINSLHGFDCKKLTFQAFRAET